MSMASTSSGAIVFYDIAPRPPVEKNYYAPNPWKTRLALNFKGVPYSTSWIGLPDIAKLRTNLKVPACRKFADGKDFYTLPVIHDTTTGSLIGDSFDIAVHLQRTYPSSGDGDLFPPQELDYEFKHEQFLVPLSECSDSAFPNYAKFNMNIDAAFTAHTQLGVMGMPFDPATEELTKAEFASRAGVAQFDDFALVGEARGKMMESFRETLGGLAGIFKRDTSGPFLLGEKASYADMIVGAWLRMLHVTLPEDEWDQVSNWHDGIFGKLHNALDIYAGVGVYSSPPTTVG